MDIYEVNSKIDDFKKKSKKWVKKHSPELIGYGIPAVVGIGITAYFIHLANSMEVTVDDVTEVRSFELPEIGQKNEITMYDDRNDWWVPVVRKLTNEEFDECKKQLEENPNMTLTDYLFVNEMIPEDYS